MDETTRVATSIASASPAPPPPLKLQPPMSLLSKDLTSEVIFTLDHIPGSQELCFTFHDVAKKPGHILLKTLVHQFIPGSLSSKFISPQRIYLVLGRLRSTSRILRDYNKSVTVDISESDGINGNENNRFRKYFALQLFSALGFQILSPRDQVKIEGLDDLITQIENLFAETLSRERSLIQQGSVSFDGLAELYIPGTFVRCATSMPGVKAAFQILEAYYEEKRTLFGVEKSFKLHLLYVCSMGNQFVVIPFEEYLSNWFGTKTQAVDALLYTICSKGDLDYLYDRGKRYARQTKGQHFLAYKSNGFFPHHNRGKSSYMTNAASTSGGRIIIDTQKGHELGHYASQGSDEATNAMMQMVGRYKRMSKETSSSKSSSSDAILVFSNLPEELFCITWPSCVGFSFAVKGWGHVLIDSLQEIEFNDRAFDQLVLTAERKQLIRALVKFGGESVFDDIIAGKSGGSVFLLHGPPGVGKTLTAEAIAEVLHKPLYYVSMGELGTTPEEMEQRLTGVLDLCNGWNALTLIDEADVFLEKRSTSDVLRNAMVCVMLRLVEYHQGILFLTTNRVKEFDPAFESRVTVALRYDQLSVDARCQVWKNLVARVQYDIAEDDIDYEYLSSVVLNGRQIKNAVRLALALAQDSGVPLSQTHLRQTIDITSLGRSEMLSSKEY